MTNGTELDTVVLAKVAYNEEHGKTPVSTPAAVQLLRAHHSARIPAIAGDVVLQGGSHSLCTSYLCG